MATRPLDLNNIKGRIAEALVEAIFRRNVEFEGQVLELEFARLEKQGRLVLKLPFDQRRLEKGRADE